nr:TatD family hydrolase [Candidatus Sigynarchaeota archaeon]
MGKALNIPEPEPDLSFCDVHGHVPWIEGTFKSDAWGKTLASADKQHADFKKAGGVFFITCSIDLNSAVEILKFVEKHRDVCYSCGMAPQTVTYTKTKAYESEFKQWLDIIEKNGEKIIAFGEIGLDFHHAKALGQRKRQIDELDRILSIVKGKKKPIVLHVRNAGPSDKDMGNPDHAFNQPDAAAREVVALLDKHGISPARVLFHCYSGPSSLNEELAKRGFFFSIPSSAFGFEKWFKVSTSLPLERIMTETDSPFQHPRSMEPINAPENARYAIAAIAHARGIDQKVVATTTLKNAKAFFKIP